MTLAEFAGYIDHTVLKPDTVAAQVERLCDEAVEHNFAAVCVSPVWVPLAVKRLRDSDVHVATVAGFPHGDTLSKAKAQETKALVDAGAHEVDMVISIGHAKMGDFRAVQDDIHAVVQAAHGYAIVKVIMENAYLNDFEKKACCLAAKEAGADYVKTSTGFASSGATAQDVRLMRDAVGVELGVKAAGGIRDLETALSMIEAGATRLGCSASVAIMQEWQQKNA